MSILLFSSLFLLMPSLAIAMDSTEKKPERLNANVSLFCGNGDAELRIGRHMEIIQEIEAAISRDNNKMIRVMIPFHSKFIIPLIELCAQRSKAGATVEMLIQKKVLYKPEMCVCVQDAVNNGVQVRTNSMLHDKMVIVDNNAFMGSSNYSLNAEKINYEGSMILKGWMQTVKAGVTFTQASELSNRFIDHIVHTPKKLKLQREAAQQHRKVAQPYQEGCFSTCDTDIQATRIARAESPNIKRFYETTMTGFPHAALAAAQQGAEVSVIVDRVAITQHTLDAWVELSKYPNAIIAIHDGPGSYHAKIEATVTKTPSGGEASFVECSSANVTTTSNHQINSSVTTHVKSVSPIARHHAAIHASALRECGNFAVGSPRGKKFKEMIERNNRYSKTPKGGVSKRTSEAPSRPVKKKARKQLNFDNENDEIQNIVIL